MTVYFTQHALDRAFERYALTLSAADMWQILSACRDGRASLMQTRDDGLVFVWRWLGRTILPVTTLARDVVVTFQPATYFAKGARREHLKTLGIDAKRSRGTADALEGRGAYKRSSIKRAREPDDPDQL